jgi:hypothetical protein
VQETDEKGPIREGDPVWIAAEPIRGQWPRELVKEGRFLGGHTTLRYHAVEGIGLVPRRLVCRSRGEAEAMVRCYLEDDLRRTEAMLAKLGRADPGQGPGPCTLIDAFNPQGS